jgi:hypothetical protein
MPRRLLHRCRPDSVREFQLAARQRFEDGVSLARTGRRTAAIYVWGYAGEMLLKAAYFHALGFPPTRTITPADLRGAIANAARLGFPWVGNLHNLESWAQLLTSTRAATPGLAYASPPFANEVLAGARRVQRLWSETLRYHNNVAYLYEVSQVRVATEWLLLHGSQL